MLHRMISNELPREFGVMSFDKWTNSYRDPYNDIWLVKRHDREEWELVSREPGNLSKLHSHHRDPQIGLEAANALHASKRVSA